MTYQKITVHLLFIFVASLILYSCSEESYEPTETSLQNTSLSDNYDSESSDSSDVDLEYEEDEYDEDESDEDESDEDESDEDVENHKEDFLDLLTDTEDCIDLTFPFSVILSDQSSIEFGNEDELATYIIYLEENNDSIYLSSIEYPLMIILYDGTTHLIESDNDFEAILISCDILEYVDDLVNEDCYSISYPFEIFFSDNISHTLEDAVQLNDLFRNIINEERLDPEEYNFGFPMTVTDNDGMSQIVNSSEELEILEDSCDD